jgi:hypothetical protein
MGKKRHGGEERPFENGCRFVHVQGQTLWFVKARPFGLYYAALIPEAMLETVEF